MKKLWIIGLILLVVGVVLFGVGYWGSGGDITVLNGDVGPIRVHLGRGTSNSVGIFSDEDAETERRVFAADGVEEIVLKELFGGVEIRPSDDGQIWLVSEETEDYRFLTEFEDGVLTLRRDSGEKEKGWKIEDDAPDVTLYLPQMPDCTIRAESKFGEVEAEDLDMDCVLTVTTEGGRVAAEDCRVRKLTMRSSMGQVEVKDVRSETSVELETKMGEVLVDGLAAGESIRLVSEMGAVHGKLAGRMEDYTIRASTSLGSCNLPEKWGRGSVTLEAETRMGEINIRFDKD